MHRNNLLELLERYNPSDKDELRYKREMHAWVKSYENCFLRSLSEGHVTASAWLTNKHNTHALLMHHAKLNNWFQLGGHCDGENNVLGVAIKEAQEESGIKEIVPVSEEIFDIDVHLIPKTSTEQEHYHYDIRFLLAVSSDEQVKKNNESKELIWIGKNRRQLPTKSSSVLRMFHKWVHFAISKAGRSPCQPCPKI